MNTEMPSPPPRAASPGRPQGSSIKALSIVLGCFCQTVPNAGTGLDFSAASAVVFVELPQEVALVRQAEDRAHRHGQKLSVNVYFLVAKGTSDERR